MVRTVVRRRPMLVLAGTAAIIGARHVGMIVPLCTERRVRQGSASILVVDRTIAEWTDDRLDIPHEHERDNGACDEAVEG